MYADLKVQFLKNQRKVSSAVIVQTSFKLRLIKFS